MPRNGSGVMIPLPGTAGVPNQPIESAKYNANNADIFQDLNTPRPVVMGGTAADNPDDAAKNLGLVSAKELAGTSVVAGTADEIEITTAREFASLTSTFFLTFRAESDSVAGGTTIDVDEIGPKALYKNVAAGLVDINVGDLLAGGYYSIVYDATADGGDGAFVVTNPGSGASAFQVGDFFDTIRVLSGDWLRRDGSLYDSDDYAELSALLPALPDGVSWSSLSSATTGDITAIISTNTGFLAVSQEGANSKVLLYTTADGWSAVATITSFSATGVASGGGIYVIVDGNGKSSVSNDKITWSTPTYAIGSGSDGCSGIAYGAGVFLIVGTAGKAVTTPDGVSFTSRTTGTANLLRGVKFVNSVFVVCGNSGTLITTPDGINYTARTSGVATTLFSAAYGAGLYVVVGASGTIITSSNLSAWTVRTSGTSLQLNDVVYSTSGFMTVGASGVARISSAGTSWAATATGISSTLQALSFDPNVQQNYFTVGDGAKILKGVRTLPTQFRVPDDNPTYGWIKAVS